MEQTQTKNKAKHITEIIFSVFSYVFFTICAIALVVTLVAKKKGDDGMQVFGYQFMTVLTESMEKNDETDVSKYDIKDIPVKSLIVIDTVPEDKAEADAWYAKLTRGDVLTFRYYYAGKQITITHRITFIEKNANGGYDITLKGDNPGGEGVHAMEQKIDTSETESFNYVIGRVTAKSYILGLLISLMKSKVGIVCIVIIPSLIIAIMEIIRIVGVVTAGKKKKVEEAHESEMEALRRELEALRQKQDAPAESTTELPVAEETPTEEASAEESAVDAPSTDASIQETDNKNPEVGEC